MECGTFGDRKGRARAFSCGEDKKVTGLGICAFPSSIASIHILRPGNFHFISRNFVNAVHTFCKPTLPPIPSLLTENPIRHLRNPSRGVVRASGNRPLPQRTSRWREKERVAAAILRKEEFEIYHPHTHKISTNTSASPRNHGQRELTFIRAVAGFGVNHERLVVAILYQFVLLGIGSPLVNTHAQTQSLRHCSHQTPALIHRLRKHEQLLVRELFVRTADGAFVAEPDRKSKGPCSRRERRQRDQRLRAEHCSSFGVEILFFSTGFRSGGIYCWLIG
jgi:hypothetical protein